MESSVTVRGQSLLCPLDDVVNVPATDAIIFSRCYIQVSELRDAINYLLTSKEDALGYVDAT
jgi:hypothetical protein